ncbi:MAG: CADD family putative folate metabolism protein [Dehalococcoidia bacterium]
MTATALNLTELDELIAERRLLDHPFYQAWNRGELTLDELRDYAGQYYAFEAAFPRFLSALHARCEDASVRQTLLTNLWDEEYGSDNHLALWVRFAEGLGMTAEEVRSAAVRENTIALIETYADLSSNASVAEGIAALYAYESQAHKVARTKIAGLKANYGIDDERTISFFSAHIDADAAHSAAEAEALDRLVETDADWEKVRAATGRARDALYGFLDGVPVSAAC